MDTDTESYWEKFGCTLFKNHWNAISKHCPKSRQLAFDALLLGELTIGAFVNSHGVGAVFKPVEYMFTRVVLPSPADLFLVRFEGSIPLRWWLTNLGDLNQNIGELGNILLNSSPPWIKLEDAPNYADGRFWYISSFMYNRFTDEGVSKATELSSDELFGVFSLFAPMWEANEQEKKVTNYLKTTLGLATEQLRGIFLARLEGRKTGQNPLGLELSKFSSKQANFIQQWVQGRINLVQKSNTTTSAASSGD